MTFSSFCLLVSVASLLLHPGQKEPRTDQIVKDAFVVGLLLGPTRE